MNIADWAESLFGVVEQDGSFVARVKLITPMSGDVWHTWVAPFPTPIDWAANAESRLRSLEQQTSGRVQVSFVAESPSGETLSQLPWKITGKSSAGNLESVQMATAQTFSALASTLERVQELQNRQLDAARSHMTQLLEDRQQLVEQLQEYRRREWEQAEHEPAPDGAVQQLLAQYGPQIGVAIELAVAHFAREFEKRAVVRQQVAPSMGAAKGKRRKAPRVEIVEES